MKFCQYLPWFCWFILDRVIHLSLMPHICPSAHVQRGVLCFMLGPLHSGLDSRALHGWLQPNLPWSKHRDAKKKQTPNAGWLSKGHVRWKFSALVTQGWHAHSSSSVETVASRITCGDPSTIFSCFFLYSPMEIYTSRKGGMGDCAIWPRIYISIKEELIILRRML